MPDMNMTSILLNLSNDIGDIKGTIGSMVGKIDRAIDMHDSCPARLGFEALKDQTATLRLIKSDGSRIGSISPAAYRALTPILMKVLPWILFALVSGAASVGYLISGNPIPTPVKTSNQSGE